jgi:2-polyprenyl-6-hydroxyphenyl methylase/3-demethylubiquinone-9 3-methyltransferase
VKRLALDAAWPPSVRESHRYDELELWGSAANPGYTYAYRNRFDITIGLVSRAARPPARVLDLAAAQGNFTLTLAEMGYDVVWNDLRAELADYVRQKHERGKVEFIPGNVFDLPAERVGRFDVVLATEVIEHVAHPDRFLAKLAGFLKPDGAIVVTTPNGGYCRNRLPRFSDCPDPSAFEAVQFRPNSDGHIFLLHPDEIVSLAQKAGLTVERLILFNNPLTSGHVKTGPLLRLLPRGLVHLLERATRKLPPAVRRPLSAQLAAALKVAGPPAAAPGPVEPAGRASV